MTASPRRVLIIRPSALGDVSRSVAALATLRRAWPRARIDWLVTDSCAAAIQHHPMLDQVVTFARDRLVRFGTGWSATREGLMLANHLRQQQYDIVYDLQGLLRSGLLTWLTRSPRRVGFADAREGAWLSYNVRIRTDSIHTVDRMLGLLEADGHRPHHDLTLYLGNEERRWLEQFHAEHGTTTNQYICMAPTARWRSKMWPMDRFAEITRRLLNGAGCGRTWPIILLSAPSERHQIKPLIEQNLTNPIPSTGRAAPLIAPNTNVGQMMALISQTRLLVSNDSAPLHIGVGFDRPVVAIFGPTDPARVGPYGRPDSVLQPTVLNQRPFKNIRRRRDPSLIAQVQTNAVWEKILKQLEDQGS